MNSSDKDSLKTPKSARDLHVMHVYKDPEFIEDFDKIEMYVDDTTELQRKYEITGEDLFYYDTRKILTSLGDKIQRRAWATFDPKTKKHAIEFDYAVSKAEIMEVWDEWEHVRDFLVGYRLKTKRKGPENHDLIYAIFKALKTHRFADVFKMYQSSKLPMYQGSNSQYDTRELLERYYNKYKPQRPPQTLNH